MELNKVLLIGNLTRDPESRMLPSGAQVVKMGLASNRRFGSGEGGERKEETLFVDVEAWNKTAELCAQYLRKGSQILVEGRLKLDQYTTQTGEKRSRIFVVADRVQFGARPDGASGGSGGGGNWSRGGESAPRSSAPSSSGSSGDADSSYNDGGTEDDLPF
jgi:single-strand DNA-binding protein